MSPDKQIEDVCGVPLEFGDTKVRVCFERQDPDRDAVILKLSTECANPKYISGRSISVALRKQSYVRGCLASSLHVHARNLMELADRMIEDIES